MKKAQITIFILLGVLILFGVGIVLFIRSQVTETADRERIERLPLEFQPVQTYVESCMLTILTSGLKRIGETGGYINLDSFGLRSDFIDATNGDAFRFNPYDENTGIAYWWHFKSSNLCKENCYCGSERPYLYEKDGSRSIEAQLNNYLLQEFGRCINNFESFKKQNYDITELGEVKVKVTVGENDVSAYIEYPLRLEKQGSEVKAKKFLVKIPLRLKRIYELASDITNAEIMYPYLERWTLEQINGFGLILDKEYMPPTSDVELDPTKQPVYWSEQKVENLFKRIILVSYVPLLQVYGTLNYDDRTNTYYERTTLPIVSSSGDTYYDLLVDFTYLDWWPIYFDISGRGTRGDLIGPETANFIDFNWFSIKRYDFYYDVSYPVMVEIKDPSTELLPYFEHGYSFRFGLEANVRDNDPLNCTGQELDSVAPPVGTQLCNPDLWCANITIETVNAKDNSYLEYVSIDYGTPDDMCNLGTTTFDKELETAVLKAQLPQCVGSGCLLTASRYNYFGNSKSYSVRCDTTQPSICNQDEVLCEGENLHIELEPYRTMNITVKKKRMMKGLSWIFNPDPAPLLKSEMAMVTFERIKENLADEDLVTTVIFYGNQTSAEISRLVPGDYKAEITLFYILPDAFGREEIVFEEKEICVRKGLFDEECNIVGPIKFNETMPIGGSIFNFTLSKYDIDNYNTIVLYAISSPDSSSFDNLDMDDVEQFSKIEEYSIQYADHLEPEFELK